MDISRASTNGPLDGQDAKEQGHIVSFRLDILTAAKSRARLIEVSTTGQLKAKLAKLKRELLTPSSSGGGAGGKFTNNPIASGKADEKIQLASMLREQVWPASASLAFLRLERVL
jgi:hypothetical protein